MTGVGYLTNHVKDLQMAIRLPCVHPNLALSGGVPPPEAPGGQQGGGGRLPLRRPAALVLQGGGRLARLLLDPGDGVQPGGHGALHHLHLRRRRRLRPRPHPREMGFIIARATTTRMEDECQEWRQVC